MPPRAKSSTTRASAPRYAHFTHRLGHGIGMDGHEWPYLVKGNTQPLEIGMTFSTSPASICAANSASGSKTICTSRLKVRVGSLPRAIPSKSLSRADSDPRFFCHVAWVRRRSVSISLESNEAVIVPDFPCPRWQGGSYTGHRCSGLARRCRQICPSTGHSNSMQISGAASVLDRVTRYLAPVRQRWVDRFAPPAIDVRIQGILSAIERSLAAGDGLGLRRAHLKHLKQGFTRSFSSSLIPLRLLRL